MRKNMAPKKKKKRNKKIVNKKATNIQQKKTNNLLPIFTKVISTILAKPFSIINLVINSVLVIAKNIFLQLFNLIKQIFKLLLSARDNFFII